MPRRSAIILIAYTSLTVLGLALIAGGLCFHPTTPDAAELPLPAIVKDRPAAELARAYFGENPPGSRGHLFLPNAGEIRTRFRRESRNPNAPLVGLTALMADPSPVLRRQAVCYLAALHDAAAQPAIIGALRDADYTVRKAACEVLGWGTLPMDAGPILRELVKSDPSVPVRVAAVLTLRSEDEDAMAVYRLGLENYWLRADCEDALARLGKLELPLPERMYWHSTAGKYEEYLKDRKVKRHLRKHGRIYFEVEESVCSGGPNHVMGVQRFWYRADEAVGQDK